MQVLESDWALVPIVIARPKPLGTTLALLLDHVVNHRKMEGSKGGNPGEWFFTNNIDVSGVTVSISLRLCMPFKCGIPETWTAALIMYNMRVDGICHHVKASNGRGGVSRGWHRHAWDPVKRTSRDLRYEIDFDHGGTEAGFVLSACKVMGVILD